MRAIIRRSAAPIFLAALLLIWEAAVHILEIGSSALPAPSRVLFQILHDFARLRNHTWVTLRESLSGLGLAAAAGIPMAAIAAGSERVRGILGSLMAFLARFPLVAMAPLMVIWFGYGYPPATAICFLICVQPVGSSFLAGCDSVPTEILTILRASGAAPWTIARRIYLPACLPYALRGLKSAVPIALAGASVTEFVGSDSGLGYLLFNAGAKAESTELFAALAILLLLSAGAHGLILLMERTWVDWPVDGRWNSGGSMPRAAPADFRDGRT